jgi:hypothetical protein
MAKHDVRGELLNSPHLFSARHNRDYETMAAYANEKFGGTLTPKDVETMMREHAADQGDAAAPRATKRTNAKRGAR